MFTMYVKGTRQTVLINYLINDFCGPKRGKKIKRHNALPPKILVKGRLIKKDFN